MKVGFRKSFTRDLNKLKHDAQWRARIREAVEQVEDDTVGFVRCLHRRDLYRYYP